MEPGKNVLLVRAEYQSTNARGTARRIRLKEGDLSHVAHKTLTEGNLQDLNLTCDRVVPDD